MIIQHVTVIWLNVHVLYDKPMMKEEDRIKLARTVLALALAWMVLTIFGVESSADTDTCKKSWCIDPWNTGNPAACIHGIDKSPNHCQDFCCSSSAFCAYYTCECRLPSTTTTSSSSSSSTLPSCYTDYGGYCEDQGLLCRWFENNDDYCWVTDCCEGRIDSDCAGCLDYCRIYCANIEPGNPKYVEWCSDDIFPTIYCSCSDLNWEEDCDNLCGGDYLGWDECNYDGSEGNVCCLGSTSTSVSTTSTTSHSTTSSSMGPCSYEHCNQLYPDVTVDVGGGIYPVEIFGYCRSNCIWYEATTGAYCAGNNVCCCGNCLVNLNE